MHGDGEKVSGLVYKDRNHGAEHQIELEGIFVQIGLVPNTEWLKDSVALSPRGEIEIDARGETSLPGDLRRGRCDYGAVQADRDRDGRGIYGGAVGVRLSNPAAGGGTGRGGGVNLPSHLGGGQWSSKSPGSSPAFSGFHLQLHRLASNACTPAPGDPGP